MEKQHVLNPKVMKTLLLLLCFYCIDCSAQSYLRNDFKESETPKIFSKEWKMIDSSGFDFEVSIVNDELVIQRYKYTPEPKYPVPGGLLIPLNDGEWGGGLFYKPNDSEKNIRFSVNGRSTHVEKYRSKKKIVAFGEIPVSKRVYGAFLLEKGNPRKIFKLKDSLYVLDGLSHLSWSSGKLYKVILNRSAFITTAICEFEDAPEAATTFGDNIFVVTEKHLYMVKGTERITVVDNPIWKWLNPTSIAAMNEDEIYIGIRGGYVKVTTATKQMIFYKYEK